MVIFATRKREITCKRMVPTNTKGMLRTITMTRASISDDMRHVGWPWVRVRVRVKVRVG